MALHDRVASLRAERLRTSGVAIPPSFQGVTKDRVRDVLSRLGLGGNADLLDGVFALLDDATESWFAKPPQGSRFCHGATTAHLACHIGILQRGGGKLDREGRDYWIKPLRELGGIEAVTLVNGRFVPGHVIAKSGNSCYRLEEGFQAIIKAGDQDWPKLLAAWASQDAARARREFQAQVAQVARLQINRGHSELIDASIRIYAARFLPGYRVIYVDDGDGDRITDEDRALFAEAGIKLTLEDGMPDVLLWNPKTDRLWVIEAVTSDGEVDIHKINQLSRLAERHAKVGIDFTTVYRTWKEAASRQSAHQNIGIGTYIWIQEDPAKHMLVKSFN